MSQEQVLKTLVGLGLTRLDSQVYIYLAKRGSQKGQDLSKGLKVQKTAALPQPEKPAEQRHRRHNA
jgi:predicted transcriptional regulator